MVLWYLVQYCTTTCAPAMSQAHEPLLINCILARKNGGLVIHECTDTCHDNLGINLALPLLTIAERHGYSTRAKSGSSDIIRCYLYWQPKEAGVFLRLLTCGTDVIKLRTDKKSSYLLWCYDITLCGGGSQPNFAAQAWLS